MTTKRAPGLDDHPAPDLALANIAKLLSPSRYRSRSPPASDPSPSPGQRDVGSRRRWAQP